MSRGACLGWHRWQEGVTPFTGKHLCLKRTPWLSEAALQPLPFCPEDVCQALHGWVAGAVWESRLTSPAAPGLRAAHPQALPLHPGGRWADPAGPPGEGRRAAAGGTGQAGASPGRCGLDETGHRGAAAAGKSAGGRAAAAAEVRDRAGREAPGGALRSLGGPLLFCHICPCDSTHLTIPGEYVFASGLG